MIRERVGQPTGIHRQESAHASLRHAESPRKRRMFRRVCARRRAIRAGGGRRHALYGEVRCGVRPDNRSIGFVACLVRPIGVPPPAEPMCRDRGHGRAASAVQRPSGSVFDIGSATARSRRACSGLAVASCAPRAIIVPTAVVRNKKNFI